MTEQKKQKTEAERKQLSRKRLEALGGGQISISINSKAKVVLDALTKEFGTQRAAIEYVILQHEQRTLL
jgi:hypothetical protein